jgi:hypothetical protein
VQRERLPLQQQHAQVRVPPEQEPETEEAQQPEEAPDEEQEQSRP